MKDYNKLMKILVFLKKKTIRIIRRNWLDFDLIVLIPIILYGIVFSHYTLLKHYDFNSYAWDLGIFNQALYTTLFYGKPLYYTAEQFLNPTGSYLAIHFSPILFILLPLYAIQPSAETLLIIKSFLLALGALPLYSLAKEKLKSKKASFMLAISYLLHPAIQGSNWFDFQQQVFIPILVFSLVLFMNKRKWKSYFLILLLSLMISEHTTLMLLALTIYYLLTTNVRRLPYLVRKFQMTRETVIVLTIALCAFFFCISECVKNLFPIRPEFLEVYEAASAYKVLGFKGGSPISLLFFILLNPDRILVSLLYDYPIKLLYIIFLFAPLAFLPFGSSMTIVTVFLLLPFLLSNYPAYYKIGAHYPLYLITPIFLASVNVLSKRTKHDIEGALKIVLVSSLIIIISTSPISPFSRPLIEQNILWYPILRPINKDLIDMHKILEMIPKNASVLTQNHIFPHISSRINAYVLPTYVGTPEQMKILKNYVNQLINKSDYIFLEIKRDDYWTNYVIEKMENNNLFGIYAFSKYALLFKKNYSGPSIATIVKGEIFIAYKDLYIKPYVKIIEDKTSKSGYTVLCPKNLKEDIFLYGPYIFLPKGIYSATCTIKIGDGGEGYLATFDVTDKIGKECVARRDLYGFEMKPNVWQNVTVIFAISKLRTNIEFRVFSAGIVDVYVDRIILKQISGEAKYDFGTKTFNYKNLRFNGVVTKDKILLRSAENEEKAWSFWFGPYISLPPGNYKVTFNLKVVPSPKIDDKIIMLEVMKNHGAEMIAGIKLYGNMVIENQTASGWCKITIEFSAETLTKEVEFRGVDPSDKYNIYLAYILLERIY